MSKPAIGRPMEILLVEDSLVDARFTIHALDSGQIKHRLTLIKDGAEALEFLRRQGKFGRAPRPDLILLDLHLPLLSGLEVLAEIKSDLQLASVPVVIVTASDDSTDIAECRELGVDSYVTKPVDLEKFLGLVRELKRYWHADLILPQVE